MKNKKIIIIIACIALISAIFAIIGYISKNNSGYESEPIVFKNFVFYTDNSYNYKKIDDFVIELSANNWTATLEILMDADEHIIDYAKCTQLLYNRPPKYETSGDYTLVNNPETKTRYFTFPFKKNIDGVETNSIIMFYDLGNHYVMKVDMTSNDSNYNEDNLKEIISILKSNQYDSKEEFDYHYYEPEYYHDCHDIEKSDEEDFKKRLEEFEKKINNPTEENVEEETTEKVEETN